MPRSTRRGPGLSTALPALLLTALVLAALPSPAAAQVQTLPQPQPIPEACVQPVPVDPAPFTLTPWFYERGSGELVWGHHQHWEDPGSSSFVLARELVQLTDQSGTWPEALVFNTALFDPPEGIDGAPRRVMSASLDRIGLQLHVNYSQRTIDSSVSADKYFNPTFFLSLDGYAVNTQTIPPVTDFGFSSQLVSATRGAFGCLKRAVPAHTAGNCDDVYVTAGLGYGLGELDPDPGHQALAAEAERDRLMWRTGAGLPWQEVSQQTACPGGAPRIPAAAAAGNSSGVVFADLTGDGWADLYVGRGGASWTGATNVLLVNDGTGCFTDQTAARIPAEPAAATHEIAAADLDLDGDLDLAVANRCARVAPCGAESEDYVLINDGAGNFALVPLNAGRATDSRSVAIGDLNQDFGPITPGVPEIVFGNAGSDGFSNQLVWPPGGDHPMEIYVNNVVLGGVLNTFTEVMAPIIGPAEAFVTAPLTRQVLLVDLFGPGSNLPDGWLDLVIVNSRDILKHDSPFGVGGNVWTLVNKADWTVPGPWMQPFNAFPSSWVRAVAAADFTKNGVKDLFQVAGNRFSGVQSETHKGIGGTPPTPPWDFSGAFINFKSYETHPGNERGYGLDFADLGDDGALDALQTSRGYDYLVRDILHPTLPATHQDFAPGFFGNGLTRNDRGRLQPQGMEDGEFFDADGDGLLDAVLASQRQPSVSWPPGGHGNASPDTIVLVQGAPGQFGYDTVGSPFSSVDDARIDLVNRVVHPGLADRVVAGDLDNDADVDAVVKLFDLPSAPTNPIDTFSFGWRYLENVTGAGSLWFRDVAPVKMKNAAGNYDPLWNRGLGMTVLADLDNNGALDLFDTVGFGKLPGEVSDVRLTDDLVFLNGVGGDPVGVLRESSASILPPRCQDVVVEFAGETQHISCGSFGLAQGDVDNDGDADVVITHYSQSGRTNYPWLLVNRLNEAAGAFVDEFQTRAPIGAFSDVIHTADQDSQGNPTVDMDRAMFPALADFDGDGDVDLIYQVVDDLPRVLLNAGRDSNGDGVIDGADTPPPGTFTDATPAVLTAFKPTTDSQDLVAVDLDGDGDYDLVNDPFNDMVTPWRNDLQPPGLEPVVTQIWPRVGWLRGLSVRLHGVNLSRVSKVEFRFAGGTCTQTAVTPVPGSGGTRLDVVIPASCPVGLAQVRVERTIPVADCPSPLKVWQKRYFGYFVLLPPALGDPDADAEPAPPPEPEP